MVWDMLDVLKRRMGINLRLKFHVKFAIKACFEFFAHCDVLSIRLTRKNSALREIFPFFLANCMYKGEKEIIYPRKNSVTHAFLIKFSSEI